MKRKKPRPKITKAIRAGWEEISAFIECELDAAQASQFECRNHHRRIAQSGDPDAEAPGEDCPCEGCVATRNARAAINWIDSRLVKE